MITHGYSGSGKSTLTQSLVEASGAIRVRADIERKRLAGMEPLDHRADAAVALYGPALTAATHARLRRFAGVILGAGFHAILDATFLRRRQRHEAQLLAARRGVGFVILDFAVGVEVLRQRLRRRQAQGQDASDADELCWPGKCGRLSLCDPISARPCSRAKLLRALRMRRLEPTGHRCWRNSGNTQHQLVDGRGRTAARFPLSVAATAAPMRSMGSPLVRTMRDWCVRSGGHRKWF